MEILNEFNFYNFIPELVIFCGALISILLGVFFRSLNDTKFFSSLSLIIFIIAFFFSIQNINYASTYNFFGMIRETLVKEILHVYLLFFSFLLSAYIVGSSANYKEYQKSEVSSLVLFVVFGALVLLKANNLITIYFGIEVQSLSLYVLASMNKSNSNSSEAGVKYFILGSIASAVILLGMSFIYGYGKGAMDITSLVNQFAPGAIYPIGLVIGVALFIVGLFFKIGAAPFHSWIPDVYQGSPLPSTAFFSVIPKLSFLFFLGYLILYDLKALREILAVIIGVVSALSMIVGSVGGLFQKNVKRLLAYSSIANVGFILSILVSDDVDAVNAYLIYCLIYGVVTIGLFSLLYILCGGAKNYSLDMFKGLFESHKMLAISFAILLFSIAGIPPLAGFIGKLYAIKSVMQAGSYYLAVLFVICSVIAAYYYLKIIKLMFFDKAESEVEVSFSPELIILSSMAVAINILLIFVPFSVINISNISAYLIHG